MKIVISFGCGILFAAGLVLSEMTLPSRVIGFLDIFGNWDPSLAFVMGGAIAVHLPFQLYFRRRPSPILDAHFHRPTRTDIDYRLIGGSVLFGIGWGLAGFCPGPNIVALVTTATEPVVFFLGMLVGILFYQFVTTLYKNPQAS